MHPGVLEQLTAERKRQNIVVQRTALLQAIAIVGCIVLLLFGALFVMGWEVSVLRSEQAAENRAAVQSAHESSVSLVRTVMELQSELDMQEDHDRNTLQLYLQLEREKIPDLTNKITKAAADCPATPRTALEAALQGFSKETHHHSEIMLSALQLHGSRARKRAQALTGHISALARADRLRLARLRANGGWSDAELEAPLRALRRRLERPNATIELSEATLAEWERVAHDALREGGAFGELKQKVLRLAGSVQLPQNDNDKHALYASEDPIKPFVSLLARARLHRHVPELQAKLEAWERGLAGSQASSPSHAAEAVTSVWDVVELVERLRAQHVLQVSLLRLDDHEWAQMVHGAAAESQVDMPPIAFDASS